jgi:hypothetical protein
MQLGHHYSVLQQCQDYIRCLPSDNNNLEARQLQLHLLATGWESLCRYKHLQYKLAHQNHFRLRFELEAPSREIRWALDCQIKLAEQFSACQKDYYLIKQWKKRVDGQLKRQQKLFAVNDMIDDQPQ